MCPTLKVEAQIVWQCYCQDILFVTLGAVLTWSNGGTPHLLRHRKVLRIPHGDTGSDGAQRPATEGE